MILISPLKKYNQIDMNVLRSKLKRNQESDLFFFTKLWPRQALVENGEIANIPNLKHQTPKFLERPVVPFLNFAKKFENIFLYHHYCHYTKKIVKNTDFQQMYVFNNNYTKTKQ